jgi:hypothetical protein
MDHGRGAKNFSEPRRQRGLGFRVVATEICQRTRAFTADRATG